MCDSDAWPCAQAESEQLLQQTAEAQQASFSLKGVYDVEPWVLAAQDERRLAAAQLSAILSTLTVSSSVLLTDGLFWLGTVPIAQMMWSPECWQPRTSDAWQLPSCPPSYQLSRWAASSNTDCDT